MCGLLLIGLMVISTCSQSLYASDSCSEVAHLREKERVLKIQIEREELLLQRLKQVNQPQKDQTRVDPPEDSHFTDCSQVFSAGFKFSGFYRIKPNGSPSPARVYCDMSGAGGWTVLQRRIDGSQRFNRSWEEYKNGFGDFEAKFGEFWIGNDNLHYLTAQGNYSLRIHLEDFDGNQRYAEYKNFKVAEEKDQYQLTFGDYVGTAGDALSGNFEVGVSGWASHQGANFSTYDQDNDNYKGNCAQEDNGGWWFNKCHSAHLNGLYYPRGHYSAWSDNGIVWFTWRGWWYSLKTSVMKIRLTDFQIDPIDGPKAVYPRPIS